VGIGDVCTKTNVGSIVMLKNVRHVPYLRMNVFSTLVMDRAGYCNHHGNGRWKLTKGLLVVARRHACYGMYKAHVKTHKKKFIEIKDFEKTSQFRVGIDGIGTKRVKLSLLNGASNEEVKDLGGLEQWEQYPPLEIVKSYEKRTIGEH